MFPCIHTHTILASPLKEGDVVLDLGASTAGFSREMVRRFGVVCHAVEAHPGNFGRIVPGVRLHRHHYLVGATAAGGRVVEHDDGTRWVSAAGPLPGRDATGRSFDVPVIDLGGLLDLAGADGIALAKIDIEGAEFALFDGAADAEILRIDQFTVEFHDFLDPALTPRVIALRRRMAGLGYRWLNFAVRTSGDVLIVKAELLPSGWQAAYLLARYGRGAGRVLGRLARPANG